MNITLRPRAVCAQSAAHLRSQGLAPLAARVLSARGVRRKEDIAPPLETLPPPQDLRGVEKFCEMIQQSISQNEKIFVSGDFDADGVCATAAMTRGLRMLGANVAWGAPSRFLHGHGLPLDLINRAAKEGASLLITVDTGIDSHEGVAAAHDAGMRVAITDHHLPAADSELPPAECIINPRQPNCHFPAKNLCGAGVAFYAVAAARAALNKKQTDLRPLLDIVAVGTIADCVPLDNANRAIVAHGIKRMRAQNTCQPGLAALLNCAGSDLARTTARDIAMQIAPRLNAAGRLAEADLAVECLLADDKERAADLARQLSSLNEQRKRLQKDALAQAANIGQDGAPAIVVSQPDLPEGVAGLLASSLAERRGKPAVVFTLSQNTLKGSARSAGGFHLHRALSQLQNEHPSLLIKFGGHAAAAGLTIHEKDFPLFSESFQNIAKENLKPSNGARIVEVDELNSPAELDHRAASQMGGVAWGKGFPPPRFAASFAIEQRRELRGGHALMQLRADGRAFRAVQFNAAPAADNQLTAVFRPEFSSRSGAQNIIIDEVIPPSGL